MSKSFSKSLESDLSLVLEEILLSEDTQIPLQEIRDLDTLKSHMSRLKDKNINHPQLAHLLRLHQKKSAILARQSGGIHAQMKAIARQHGYTGRGNTLTHKPSGHTLKINPNGTWQHQKMGVKRSNGSHTGLSAINGLRNHLTKIHG